MSLITQVKKNLCPLSHRSKKTHVPYHTVWYPICVIRDVTLDLYFNLEYSSTYLCKQWGTCNFSHKNPWKTRKSPVRRHKLPGPELLRTLLWVEFYKLEKFWFVCSNKQKRLSRFEPDYSWFLKLANWLLVVTYYPTTRAQARSNLVRVPGVWNHGREIRKKTNSGKINHFNQERRVIFLIFADFTPKNNPTYGLEGSQ